MIERNGQSGFTSPYPPSVVVVLVVCVIVAVLLVLVALVLVVLLTVEEVPVVRSRDRFLVPPLSCPFSDPPPKVYLSGGWNGTYR